MLKDAKGKVVRDAEEAFLRADAIKRGAEDAKTVWRWSQLLGKINGLETQLKRSATTVKENSRL